MRSASDCLCREYGLSVIAHSEKGKSRHYAEWRAEQEGKPTCLSPLLLSARYLTKGERLTEVKAEISALTGQIGELRKGVVLCDGIAARSGVIQEKLEAVRQEKENQATRKEEMSHEHIRRSR